MQGGMIHARSFTAGPEGARLQGIGSSLTSETIMIGASRRPWGEGTGFGEGGETVAVCRGSVCRQ